MYTKYRDDCTFYKKQKYTNGKECKFTEGMNRAR